MSSPKPAPPCTILIFGAVGDLTKRLLMPAIYNLAGSKMLDDGTKIIGLDHNDRTTASWGSQLNDALQSFTQAAGAEFHPDLDVGRFEAIFRKGAYDAGYSGFSGLDERGTPLAEWLRQRDVDQVDVVGIATDHCVRRTAEDAVKEGVGTRVLVDLTAGVGAESTAAAVEAVRAAGVTIVAGT